MKIGILGYGREGKAVENFFRAHGETDFVIFDHFRSKNDLDLDKISACDLVFRTPSVPIYWFFDEKGRLPQNFTSSTRYFFAHKSHPVIGITGTKGKGTTCTIVNAVLQGLGLKTSLIGNIGSPAIGHLDDETDVYIFELSSFQLWDLEKSPEIAVVLRIEPDHLNVHQNFSDYVAAKSNIAAHQIVKNACIFFISNEFSQKIAEKSPGEKIAYPVAWKSQNCSNSSARPSSAPSPSAEKALLAEILSSLSLPGAHNQENAEAALLAVYAYLKRFQPTLLTHSEKTALETTLSVSSPDHLPQIGQNQTGKSNTFFDFLSENQENLKKSLKSVRGLPHHLEFVRELQGIEFYDDSCSASSPSLEVAIQSFPENEIYLIAGGFDRGLDLTPEKTAIFGSKNVKKAFLIGQTAEKLTKNENSEKFILEPTLEKAVADAFNTVASQKETGRRASSKKSSSPVVLFSPGAPSFDMFKDFYDRGEKFQKIVKELK